MEQDIVISDKKKIMKIIDNTTLIQHHIRSIFNGYINPWHIRILYLSDTKISIHFRPMNMATIDNDETLISLLNGIINKNDIPVDGMKIFNIEYRFKKNGLLKSVTVIDFNYKSITFEIKY